MIPPMKAWKLVHTSTPRIFTIQHLELPTILNAMAVVTGTLGVPQWLNRATLALDPELAPEQIEKWRRFVEEAMNEKEERGR